MNGILERSACDPLLDLGSLRARPRGELLRIWWRVGCALLAAWAAWVLVWATRSRQRQDLRDLDPHLLRDIGLTTGQAAREAHKCFWQE
jgi:uncharacterized protein YjiS (DUF1127 family)